MLDLSKKIISYVVVFSIVLSFSTFAYADDTESDLTGDSPVSSDTVSENDITVENVNEQLIILASNISKLQASNATYDTTDIYLLLQQMLNYNYNNQSASILFRIHNALLQTNLNFTTLFNKIDSINSKLTNEDDTLNIYDLCGDMFEQIINHLTVSVGENIYSITDVCILIEDRIASIQDHLTTIEGMLVTLNNTTSAINTVINNLVSIATNIATNTANTIIAVNNNTTAINNLDTHLNNIEWLDSSATYLGFNHDRSTTYVTGQFKSNSYPVGYFYFTNSGMNYGRFYRFRIPVRGSVSTNEIIKSIQFTYNDNQFINPEYYDYDYTRGYVNIYCNAPMQFGTNRNVVIKVTFAYNYTILTDSYNVNYINQTDKDYYTIYEYITYLKQNRTLNKFEYLYASDDLIKAKDAQQPLEDQVLQDFTGNGSASAKLSDAASAKDASSALKTGLTTGYSASDALSVFNSFQASDYGLFAWFSPENATYFNNNTNKNLLKSNMGVNDDYSSIVWTDSIPDVTSDIDRQYIEGMSYGQSDK